MTWVAEEDFESYSDELSLVGANGGSGWSAAWANAAVNLERADNATAYEGTFSARAVTNGGGNTFFTRLLTTTISGSGTVYFGMRKSSTSAGENAFSFRSSGGGRISIVMNASGNIVANGTTLVTGFTANQWYVVEVNYNVGAGNYTARVHNGTSWTTLSGTITMSGSGNLDRVGMGGDNGADSWIDKITATNPVASSASSSPSASASASPSSSPSSSVSASISSSPSASISASPSTSPSASISSSPSSSISTSPSEGSSPSSSPSSSISSSPSSSPSVSSSPSSSISSSPSSSISASISASPSSSISTSPSASVSSSPSASVSASSSSSPSTSVSTSPSAGVGDYYFPLKRYNNDIGEWERLS